MSEEAVDAVKGTSPAMEETVLETTCELPEINGGHEQVKVDEVESDPKTGMNMSGYDSTGSYSDHENESVSGSESENSVNFEREEGDGQESIPTKKVDDDEDKKNPQYIPKRGTFYEHDDRTADDIENEEPEKEEKDGKKKVWQEKKEKWSHDKFNDSDQAPKSKSELVAIYGYDIRNEDGPPKARRRRRYGRGPNKYTRNWEDEDAYGKTTVIRKPGSKKPGNRPRNESDPSENNSDDEQKPSEELPKHTSAPQDSFKIEQDRDNNRTITHNVEERPAQRPRGDWESERRNGPPPQSERPFPQNRNPRVGTGRISKPKRDFQDKDYQGFTKTRQFKSSGPPPKPQTRGPSLHDQHPSNKNQGMQGLERDVGRMHIQEQQQGGYNKPNVKHNSNRQGSVPPRLQSEQKGSKRYSSIRQRSLPETANPPFPPQHGNFYPNEYNQQSQPVQPQGNLIPGGVIHPQGGQMPPPIPNPALAPLPAQVPPVTTAPLLQAPPQYPTPFPPAPSFMQPGVAPPSFIPPPTAPIINYGQPQYPQAPFQGFPQQFSAVNQPTELYQPQGGITYYSPQEQQAAQRAALTKRPKAAIPIVAPPEHRGRGRSNQRPLLQSEGELPAEVTPDNSEKYADAIEIAAAQ